MVISSRSKRGVYLRAGPDDHALDPEADEGQKRAERLHDVRVVGARFADHAAQFGVAVGSDHRKHA